MFLYTQYTLSPLLPCHKLFQLFSSIPFLTKKAILTTRLRESLTSFLRTVLTTYFFSVLHLPKKILLIYGILNQTCFDSSSEEIPAKNHSDMQLDLQSSGV